MTTVIFSIADDFSPFPGPRFKEQGPDSGEKLSRILARKLRETHAKFRILMDGTTGIGSSFIDQAFGGLVSDHGFNARELEGRLIFVSEVDPSYVTLAIDSIRKAGQQRVAAAC